MFSAAEVLVEECESPKGLFSKILHKICELYCVGYFMLKNQIFLNRPWI